ncbi:protein translocase subunit SecD [Christensenella sp. MSJ-20]|uniref:protein translocase subunit SecD n=1 Tax=Christensenella sp. MSJ-20 TaxID=2841518 RepID=UPI001C788592|nr:protein translocase subunit SecD [Christensenella sp. MSJ-20]
MKKQGIVTLSVTIILLAVLLYLALFGVSFGLREIRPMATLIKEQKLGLDLTGGFYAVYQAVDPTIEDFEAKMDGAVLVYRNRLDAKGMTEATVQRQGSDKIRVEIPSTETDPQALSQFLSTPAKLEWKDNDGNVIMEGANVVSAQAGYSDGQYVVSFKLDDEGKKTFASLTAEYAGTSKTITIELDGSVISTATVSNTIASGEGIIQGGFTQESATTLAMQIESGALPLEISESEVRSVSATLGADALSKGVLAGAIGVGLIVLFMLCIYRLPGLIASIALMFYILITFFCILTLPGVQLTLPGVAGVILSIGMAVDANVIIFERIREEMRSGKSLRTSVENGFQKAFRAILDSNVTTLIAAGTLIIFGTGSIKGFGYTLAIGICVSMLTAVVITRFLMKQVVKIGITDKRFYAK